MTLTVHRHTDPPIDFDGQVTLADWVESLPSFDGRRPRMTGNGYSYLLRYMLAGGSVPYYTDPTDLLRDMHLAYEGQVSRLERRAEFAEVSAARFEPAVKRLWSLVFAAGKRKTMRTEDVRAALEGAQ